MARPRTISDEQILDAARAVFLRDGVAASTATVAREAGVSEGTVFRRFATKDELFRAAMMSAATWRLDYEERVGEGDVTEHLAEVILELMEGMRGTLPCMMALATHASVSLPDMWREQPEQAPVVVLKALTNYLDAEMRLGRLGVADPEVVARTIMGAVHNYAFFELMGMHARMPIAAPTFARGLVDLLWRGLVPSNPAAMVKG